MRPQFRDQVESHHRRTSEPHSHHHIQPKYPAPPRRSTDAGQLYKIHSRPEDYMNKPRPDKLFEYVCFEGEEPVEGHEYEQKKTSLDRTESNDTSSSSITVESEDYDGDSEDELTLPSTYHHDVGHRSDCYDSWGTRTKNTKAMEYDPYPSEEHGRLDLEHNRRTSPSHRRDSSSSSRSSRRHSPRGSEDDDDLIAQVAQHLQSHKAAYAKNHNASEVVSELLGEVVRKVSDGGLSDGNLIKEVLREVQHVL